MTARRYSLISLTLISSLALFFLAPAKAANPDDGYPEGVAAPGRTCPNSDEGFSALSEISGKTLVCTMINGVKKWWIKGEPLPTAPTAQLQQQQLQHHLKLQRLLPAIPT
jgi:hypothetical protein